jgi:hypothetical protein
MPVTDTRISRMLRRPKIIARAFAFLDVPDIEASFSSSLFFAETGTLFLHLAKCRRHRLVNLQREARFNIGHRVAN